MIWGAASQRELGSDQALSLVADIQVDPGALEQGAHTEATVPDGLSALSCKSCFVLFSFTDAERTF